MAALAAAESPAVAGPRIATESLRALLLWLMAFAGGVRADRTRPL